MSVFLDSQCDLPLFVQRAPSVNGSITSAKAADSLGPATLNAMQRRVLELLAATPDGLTDEEQQRLTDGGCVACGLTKDRTDGTDATTETWLLL